MTKLQSQLITPQSLLIEQTAKKMAEAYYEIGRSQGLKSKYKTHQEFAKRYLEKFIPLAVNQLIDMLALPHIPQDQKDMIYDALMERTNDPGLSNSGIPVFANNTPYKSDKFVPTAPIVINTRGGKGRIEDVLDYQIKKGNIHHGQESH